METIGQWSTLLVFLAALALFIATILVPIFVMLIYFKLNEIHAFLRRAATSPEKQKQIEEKLDQYRKKRK